MGCMARPPQYDHLFKILLVGNARVGKTSFMNHWAVRDSPPRASQCDFEWKPDASMCAPAARSSWSGTTCTMA